MAAISRPGVEGRPACATRRGTACPVRPGISRHSQASGPLEVHPVVAETDQ
jgi:hypothetical protein